MVTVLLFHGISPSASAADQSTQYFLLKLLEEKGVLTKVFCLHKEHTSEIPDNKIVAIGDKLGFKILIKTMDYVNKIWKGFNSRYYKEIVFDLICMIYISIDDTRLIYASKPLFTHSFRKCHNCGIKILTRASVAHPLFNYYLIKNEEARLGLRSWSSYTDIKRSNRLLKSLHLSDGVLINHIDEADEFLMSTYKNCFHSDNLIPYKTMFISQPIDEQLTPTKHDNAITFIHVAFMNLIKGTHYLLEAWEQFQSTYQHAELVLIGGMDSSITDIFPASRLAAIPGLKVVGYQQEPFKKYSHASAFISASLSESGPATILEALSMGIPTITTKNCGLSNIILDQYNGFTYDFNDCNKLVEIFEWFIQNPSKISGLRGNAKETADEFTIKYFNNEMWPIFKRHLPER